MDPSEMSDEELDAAISGQPEETPNEEASSPPAEETPKETPEPDKETAPAEETPAEAPAPETPAPEGEPPISRREQLRVQKLLEKYGPPPEKKAEPAPSQRPNYAEMLDAPEEVIDTLNKTAEELDKTAYDRGTNDTLKQLQTVEWRTNLRIDNQEVERSFPQLNKNDPQFHPVLADAMNRRYLALVGFNLETGLVERPGISYLDFVESEFELADEIATTKTADTTKNIAKQAAQTGLRPDGSAAKGLDLNKPAEQMTDEELDAKIKQIPLRDRYGRFISK